MQSTLVAAIKRTDPHAYPGCGTRFSHQENDNSQDEDRQGRLSNPKAPASQNPSLSGCLHGCGGVGRRPARRCDGGGRRSDRRGRCRCGRSRLDRQGIDSECRRLGDRGARSGGWRGRRPGLATMNDQRRHDSGCGAWGMWCGRRYHDLSQRRGQRRHLDRPRRHGHSIVCDLAVLGAQHGDKGNERLFLRLGPRPVGPVDFVIERGAVIFSFPSETKTTVM